MEMSPDYLTTWISSRVYYQKSIIRCPYLADGNEWTFSIISRRESNKVHSFPWGRGENAAAITAGEMIY